MDLRKIFVLCVLLVVVFSAFGAVSAGWFDFGEEDASITISGKLTEGSSRMQLSDRDDDHFKHERFTSCYVDLPLTDEQKELIKDYLFSDSNTCNVTYGNGTSEVFTHTNKSDLTLGLSGDELYIGGSKVIYTNSEVSEDPCGVSEGTLVIPTEKGVITINFK